MIGKTGLSLLAFLGAGHTPDSGTEYSDVAAGAVSFLLAVQDERTGHFGDTSSYGHAVATYALAECYALTNMAELRRPLERATEWIVSHQETNRDQRLFGGWGYYYPDGHEFDRWPRASVTVWQVMALESARLGGIDVEDRVFADARTFLLGCWDRERRAYRYSHDPTRLRSDYDVLPGSTPASLFALSLLGEDVSAGDYRTARAYVLDRVPDGYRYRGDDAFVHRAQGNLYFWYYGSLALFRVGGSPWERWNTAMKETLLPSQESDGFLAADLRLCARVRRGRRRRSVLQHGGLRADPRGVLPLLHDLVEGRVGAESSPLAVRSVGGLAGPPHSGREAPGVAAARLTGEGPGTPRPWEGPPGVSSRTLPGPIVPMVTGPG